MWILLPEGKQQIFHLERSSFFYLSVLMVRTQRSASLPVVGSEHRLLHYLIPGDYQLLFFRRSVFAEAKCPEAMLNYIVFESRSWTWLGTAWQNVIPVIKCGMEKECNEVAKQSCDTLSMSYPSGYLLVSCYQWMINLGLFITNIQWTWTISHSISKVSVTLFVCELKLSSHGSCQVTRVWSKRGSLKLSLIILKSFIVFMYALILLYLVPYWM